MCDTIGWNYPYLMRIWKVSNYPSPGFSTYIDPLNFEGSDVRETNMEAAGQSLLAGITENERMLNND